MKEIEVLVESPNGHDTKLFPEGDIPLEVSKELKQDKWATVKKTDGSTEVLTKADAPSEDDWKNSFASKPSKDEELEKPIPSKVSDKVVNGFKNKFKDVESVLVTNKSKGG